MTLALNAISGILISAILKFLSNIAVVFSHALSIFVVAFASAYFFGLHLSLSFVAGLAFVTVAILAYNDPDNKK